VENAPLSKTETINPAALAVEIGERIEALSSLKTEHVRALRREYSKRLAQAPPEAVIELGLRLLNQPRLEARFVAYELVSHHRAALSRLKAQDLEQFGRGLDSWWTVDTFACYLSGPAWREDQIPDSLIRRWARSKDRWWRRAALVSTIPLNNKARGGSGDTARTLAVCEMLAEDRDDMVVKALSWALRELAKRDPKAVREFLLAHKDRLAPRVIREVRNKLTTGLKNPRR
jgi:3-methyladenine DNA glycosylase AlkD